jgi:GNAT superfamily N-acetyltransferase
MAPRRLQQRENDMTDEGTITRELALALEDIEIAAWSDLFRAADAKQISACGLELHESAGAVASIVKTCDVLAFNRVIGLGTRKPAGDREVRGVINRYLRAGLPRMFVQINPVLADPELFKVLSLHGMEHYNNWVKLYRDTSPLPPVSTDLTIELIDSRWAGDFARLAAEAFDWPESVQPWIAASIGRDGWRHYAAFDGNRPVATAAIFISGEWSWIDLAATHEDYRGRGAQGKLLEQRILDAAELGCKWIAVETAEETPNKDAPSYRNMIRYGFREAYVRPNYLWRERV